MQDFFFVHVRWNFIFLLGQTPVGIYVFFINNFLGKICFLLFLKSPETHLFQLILRKFGQIFVTIMLVYVENIILI